MVDLIFANFTSNHLRRPQQQMTNQSTQTEGGGRTDGRQVSGVLIKHESKFAKSQATKFIKQY